MGVVPDDPILQGDTPGVTEPVDFRIPGVTEPVDFRLADLLPTGQFPSDVREGMTAPTFTTPTVPQPEIQFSDEEQITIAEIVTNEFTNNAGWWDFQSLEDQEHLTGLAELVVAFSRGHPEIIEFAKRDLEAAAKVSQSEHLVNRILGGDVTDDLITFAIQTVDEAVAHGMATEELRAEVADREQYEIWLNGPMQFEDYAPVDPEERERFISRGEEPDWGAFDRVSTFVNQNYPQAAIDNPVVFRFTESMDRMLVTVGDEYIDVSLGPGVDLNNRIDAMEALGDAISGRGRHQIVGQSAPRNESFIFNRVIGGFMDLMGNTWEENNGPVNWTIGQIERLMGYDRQPLNQSTADARRVREEEFVSLASEDRERQVEAGLTTDIGMAILAAQRMYEENPAGGWYGASQDAVQFVNALDSKERAKLDQKVKDGVTAEEFRDEIEATIDTRSGLRRSVDGMIERGIINPLATYGRWLDYAAVHAVDIFGDIAQGVGGAFQGIFDDDYDGPTGFDAFKSTWDWTEHNRISEYVGLEDSGFGLFLDIAANLAIDPALWVSPSVRSQARWYRRMMTQPENVRKVMRSPVVRKIVDDAWRLQKADNPMGVAVLAHGMDDAHLVRLLEAPNRTAFIKAWAESLPAAGRGGTYLMNLHGRIMLRNTSMQVASMAGLARKDKEVRDTLTRLLGGFERDRVLSVAPSQFLSDSLDTLIQIGYHLDPADLKRWVDEAVEVWKGYQGGRAVQLEMAQSRADEASKILSDMKLGEPSALRGFTKHYGPEGSLSAGGASEFPKLRDEIFTSERRVEAIDTEIGVLRARGGDDAAERIALLEKEKAAITSDDWEEFQQLTARQRELSDAHPVTAQQRAEIHAKTGSFPEVPKPIIEEYQRNLARLRELRGRPFLRGFGSADEVFQDMLRAHQEWLDDIAEASKAREAALRAVEAVDGIASRDPFAQWFARFEEWYGVEHLGLTHTGKGRNLYTGNRNLNWETITKQNNAQKRYRQDDVERLAPMAIDPLTGEVDRVVLNALQDTGMFAKQSYYYLHASPMEMVAARTAKNEGWFQRYVASSVTGPRTRVGEIIDPFFREMQRAFASILLSPRIAFRSGLDEWVRAAADGRRLWSGHRASHIDPVTREIVPTAERIPGVLGGTVRQFGRGKRLGLSDTSARAVRESFSPSSPYASHSGSGWGWADPAVKAQRGAHRRATARFVNGNLMDNERMQAWAQSVMMTADEMGVTVAEVLRTTNVGDWNLAPLSDWYRGGGAYEIDSYMMEIGDTVRAADLVNHADATRNGFRLLAVQGAEDDLLNTIIPRIARNEKLQPRVDEYIIRKFGRMPTDEVWAQTSGIPGLTRSWGKDNRLPGMMDATFHGLYGNPGANRYGIIHQDYYDQALTTLFEAHTNAGTLIDAATLARHADIPIERAELMLLTRPDTVDRIAHRMGMVTARRLEVAADKYARLRANHLMYQPGATSMLGAKVQRHVPFGPAQFDFLSWWGNELGKAAVVGMFGKHYQIPNFFRIDRMIQGRPLGALPFNNRLIARLGEVGGSMANHGVEGFGSDDEDAFSWADVVSELTFMPDVTDPMNFMIDFGAPIGPFDAWMLRFIPDEWTEGDPDDEWYKQLLGTVRETVEAMQPALGFHPDSTLTWGGAWSLGQAILPNYDGSPFNVIGATAEGFTRLMRMVTGDGFFEGQFGGRPSGYSYGLNHAMSQDFEETWAPGTRGGGPPLSERMAAMGEEANRVTVGGDLASSFLAMFPFGRSFSPGPSDVGMEHWGGFVTEVLPFLLEFGMVGELRVRDLQKLYGKWQDEGLTADEFEDFKSVAINTLFGLRDFDLAIPITKPDPEDSFEIEIPLQSLIVAQHPEVAPTFVGFYQCAVDGQSGRYVNPDGCNSAGQPDLPAGDPREARRIIREGLEGANPWIEVRGDLDRAVEAEYRIAAARQDLKRFAYQMIFERSRFDPANLPDSLKEAEIGLPQSGLVYEAMRVIGMFDGQIPELVTGLELANEFRFISEGLGRVEYPWQFSNSLEGNLIRDERDAFEFFERIDMVSELAEDAGYGDYPAEWPQEFLDAIIEEGRELVTKIDWFTVEHWNSNFGRWYGPMDESWWEAPPLLGDESISREWRIDPEDIRVVDGDTLHITMADGVSQPVRLIGINAPDRPMPGWHDAYRDLLSAVKEEGREVHLVIWQPEKFGTEAGRDFINGEPRVKMWLYLDGQPAYIRETFTHRNPQGIGTGVEYIPIPRPETLG